MRNLRSPCLAKTARQRQRLLGSTTRTLDGNLFPLGTLIRVFLCVCADSRLGVRHLASSVHLGEVGEGGFELEFLETGGDLFISIQDITIYSTN